MQILIIGGAGYIGIHVVHAFRDRGYDVAILDNFSSGSRVNIPDGIPVFEGDIMNPDVLKEILAKGWDAVVHLAAFKAAGESMMNPGKYAVNNISGTINLLNAITDAGSPFMVFSSSAAIFGEPLRLPIDEDHPKSPENFYGFTKLNIENLLDWYGKICGLKSVSLRYFNAAGYDIKGRVSETEKDPQNLLPIVMERAAGIRRSLTIFGDDYDTPDGTCIRDYVHVSDLADAHVLAVDYLRKSGESAKINLGSETGISVLEMVKASQRITAMDFPYEIGPRRTGDPAKLVASSDLARKCLNWEARHSDLESLIGSTWKLYKNTSSS